MRFAPLLVTEACSELTRYSPSPSSHSVELNDSVACVAIYQAPQPAYDVFDKVIVLYEGQQIYFGPTGEAKQFFVDMGFYCAE